MRSSASRPELRQDIVSRDWILVAPARGKRPHHFREPVSREATSKNNCLFEDPQKAGNENPVIWFSKRGREDGPLQEDWILQVVPNKYPAVTPHRKGTCPVTLPIGLYKKMAGIGFHEVIIPRSHTAFLADISPREAEVVVRAYQERFRELKSERCLEYILLFHNHRRAAGASIWHPHSQLIALPIVPPDVQRSLSGAELYWHEHKRCAYCEIIAWERKQKERIIYKNKAFILVTPFASRKAFEMRIFPLSHEPRFELLRERDIGLFADVLVTALKRLKRTLKNPPYNFFIHTAPIRKGEFPYYHWHLEILPKTSHHAAFELGTGVEVLSVAPEEAARQLRGR